MHKQATTKRIAVIGGGLAGLSAAHRLNELAKERGQTVDVTILEAGPRLGGIVGTERIGEYLVDVGADSFLTNKPQAVSLCRRLGIEDRLVPTDSRFRGALVLHDGRPVPVPEGFQLLSPTAIWPVMTSPLFSVWGKIRLLMEYFVPRRSLPASSPRKIDSQSPAGAALATEGLTDESLADFVRRRFGREALERLIQPLVGGIYTADPEQLSLAATMPRFLEMERDYGSLIRASMRQRTPRPTDNRTSETRDKIPTQDTSSGARYGLFAGLKGGMNDLIDALRTHVERNCDVRLNCRVISAAKLAPREGEAPAEPLSRCVSVLPGSAGASPSQEIPADQAGYELTLANGPQERFDAVIVAATASRTAAVLESHNPQLSQELRGIEYASSALVVTGHQLADIRHPLNSFGLVVPHIERRRILAVSFSSRKFPDRAPVGRVLLRTFVGGALQPDLFEQSDEQMIEAVLSELAEIFGVRGDPDFSRVYRYERAMPQYHVGHLDRIARIESLVRQNPGLALAGNAYRGVGIPDVIASGERAAEDVF